MSSQLAEGTCINTILGNELRVLRFIGGGGQGDVYKVLYMGRHMALKWYTRPPYDQRNFVRNLKNNILSGSPYESFIWPKDMTVLHQGAFGYVMDLIPDNYMEARDFLLNRVTFPSFRRLIDACQNIVTAFRVLHGSGYSYKDVNTGNFHIDPQTGKVLICDNDNVTPNTYVMGVQGTLGFMAPEVVLGKHPDTRSDLHSLSVLLFELFFHAHPLEGRRAMGSVLDRQTKEWLFGKQPLFVFDADCDANRLDPQRHAAAIKLWECLPERTRQLFQRAFSQDSLYDPSCRPLEVEWTQEFVRLRSEILTCPQCGNEVFSEEGRPVACERCGCVVRAPYRLDLRDLSAARHRHKGRRDAGVGTHLYWLPGAWDTRLYEIQTHICVPQKALRPVGWISRSQNDQNILGLRNMSEWSWQVADRQGHVYELPPGKVDVLRPGMSIAIRNYLRIDVHSTREER